MASMLANRAVLDRVRERETRIAGLDARALLHLPDRREHRLREGPADDALAIQAQRLGEACDAPIEGRRFGEKLDPLARIAQRRADFVFELAHEPLRIDGDPAAAVVAKDVVVVQVAVKKSHVALGGHQPRELLARPVKQRAIDLRIPARDDSAITS